MGKVQNTISTIASVWEQVHHMIYCGYELPTSDVTATFLFLIAMVTAGAAFIIGFVPVRYPVFVFGLVVLRADDAFLYFVCGRGNELGSVTAFFNKLAEKNTLEKLTSVGSAWKPKAVLLRFLCRVPDEPALRYQRLFEEYLNINDTVTRRVERALQRLSDIDRFKLADELTAEARRLALFVQALCFSRRRGGQTLRHLYRLANGTVLGMCYMALTQSSCLGVLARFSRSKA